MLKRKFIAAALLAPLLFVLAQTAAPGGTAGAAPAAPDAVVGATPGTASGRPGHSARRPASVRRRSSGLRRASRIRASMAECSRNARILDRKLDDRRKHQAGSHDQPSAPRLRPPITGTFSTNPSISSMPGSTGSSSIGFEHPRRPRSRSSPSVASPAFSDRRRPRTGSSRRRDEQAGAAGSLCAGAQRPRGHAGCGVEEGRPGPRCQSPRVPIDELPVDPAWKLIEGFVLNVPVIGA